MSAMPCRLLCYTPTAACMLCRARYLYLLPRMVRASRIPRYAPAASGIHSTPRIPASGQNVSSRHVLASPDTRSEGRNECRSGLLIRGFGIRVPGGAPVLTWGYVTPGLDYSGRRPFHGRQGCVISARSPQAPAVPVTGAAEQFVPSRPQCSAPPPPMSEFEGHAGGGAEVGHAGAEAGRRIRAEHGVLALLAGGG